jgi:hypothetical protein
MVDAEQRKSRPSEMRRQLAARLNEIPDVLFPEERLDTWATMPLSALYDATALERFLDTWE